MTAPDPAWVQEDAAAAEVTALAAPTWTFVRNHCFTQITDTWSVLDHCYYKYKLADDPAQAHPAGTPCSDTGRRIANSPWVLDLARIRAYRSGGSSQSWADWNPRVDWFGGNCSTTSIGISTPVGGISKSFERCPDQVTFSKSANGSQPDYTQTWFGMGTRGNREVNFEIAVGDRPVALPPARCRPLSMGAPAQECRSPAKSCSWRLPYSSWRAPRARHRPERSRRSRKQRCS